MDEKEFKELMKNMEEQGWKPMLCDSPIQYYDNGVACGVPNDVGDIVSELFLMPRENIDGRMVIAVKAKGDSMVGANIMDGDGLLVTATSSPHDGDIVMAVVDGEYTVKTYCEDEDGRPWLIPQNDAYLAFPLVANERTWIVGIITQVIKNSQRTSYRDCIKKIAKAKSEKKEEQEPVSPLRMQEVINTMSTMINIGRLWYAVCRVYMDYNVIDENDFESFCKLVEEVVPRHEHLPTVQEMQRMATLSFAKPVARWREGNAPVGGKRYNDYVKIAKLTESLLNAK